MPALPREAIDVYSRDMGKLMKIYWGEGKILPLTKMTQLLELAKNLMTRMKQKKSSASKKKEDASGSSRRRREKRLLSE